MQTGAGDEIARIDQDGNVVTRHSVSGTLTEVFDFDAATGRLTPVQTLYDDTDGVDGLFYGKTVVVSPDGTRLYVAEQGVDRLHIIDTATLDTVAKLSCRLGGSWSILSR